MIIRDLTGEDRRWLLLTSEKRQRARGPAVLREPDPENPAVMRETVNPDAVPSTEDNLDLLDQLAARVIESWSLPGDMPYTPDHQRFLPLECTQAFEDGIGEVAQSLSRGGPKDKTATTDGATSAISSPGSEETPLTEPAELSSSTAGG